MSARYASIDIGTNSVLLLVAARTATGRFEPVSEKAEMTRLGKGVDHTGRLADDSMEVTCDVVARFAEEARLLGARGIAVSATSAARDASNGSEFVRRVTERAKVSVDILSGDEEARLSFASAHADFGGSAPLVVVDIGGGSTEFIYGDRTGVISFRKSFDIGSVRLTERFIRQDPPAADEIRAVESHLANTLKALPPPAPDARLIGVAGTVTTVCAVARSIDPYVTERVHGAVLTVAEIERTATALAALPVAERKHLKGLQPKRADIIVAGSLILVAALRCVQADAVVVSDRGLRWGLIVDRFGKAS